MSAEIDVIVAGAGPAGATAARGLAAGGARVLLLDSAVFPRNKPCGGGISVRALRRFPYLDAALTRIPTHTVSTLYLEGPSGRSARIRSEQPAALMIRRLEFDNLLVDLALEAGARLETGVHIARAAADTTGVTLTARDGRAYRASTVIAADGVHSVIARRLGLNPGWRRTAVALDMMEETPTPMLECAEPETMWVAYGYGGSEGYAYVFPKRAHVNVGIGCVLSSFDRVREPPYARQQAFVDALVIRGVLAGTSSRGHFTPFIIPVGGPLPRTVSGRVLLAGDAGGFVNGFTAEGIYYAMVTGELAARTVLAAGPRRSLAGYERAWKREIGTELRESVLVQRFLMGTPSRIDRVVAGARSHPAVAGTIVDYLMGRRSYAAAKWSLLLRFPSAAWKLLSFARAPHAASTAPAAPDTFSPPSL